MQMFAASFGVFFFSLGCLWRHQHQTVSKCGSCRAWVHAFRVHSSNPKHTSRCKCYQNRPKNSKIPNHPLFHSCTAKPVSRIRKHTEAFWETCRTRFDDALKQSRLSDNTARLSFLNPICAARDELSRWLKVMLCCGFRSFMHLL